MEIFKWNLFLHQTFINILIHTPCWNIKFRSFHLLLTLSFSVLRKGIYHSFYTFYEILIVCFKKYWSLPPPPEFIFSTRLSFGNEYNGPLWQIKAAFHQILITLNHCLVHWILPFQMQRGVKLTFLFINVSSLHFCKTDLHVWFTHFWRSHTSFLSN